MAHLDAVSRMFAPEVDPDAIPPRRAREGIPYPVDNLSRRILGVRRRGEPMPSMDVAKAIAGEMGFPAEASGAIANRGRHGLQAPVAA